MKILAAMVVAAAVAGAGIVIFAMANLKALIAAHQDQLVARVERVIGRPVTVASVGPSWWPLGVRLRTVTVGEDASFGAEPFLVAEGIVMSVRPWSLVHGRIEAAGVVLDRPRVTLVRDGDGRWNVESLGEAESDRAERAAGTAKTKERRRAPRVPLEWTVGLALSSVRDGTIVITDRRAGDTPNLVLRHVRLRAENVRLGATARVRIDAGLFASDQPDLHIDVRAAELGQHDVEHAPLMVRLEVDDADLTMLAGWLGRANFATGRVQRLVVDAAGSLARLQGTLVLEAVDPALRVGGVPLGTQQPIVVQATVERTADAITIADLRGRLGTLGLRAHGDATERPWRVALAVTSEAASTLALAVGPTPLEVGAFDGRIAVDREGVALAPLRLQVGGAPLEIRGWITGTDPPVLDLQLDGRPFGGTLVADVALDASGGARARIDAHVLALAALAELVPALRGRITGTAAVAALVTARVAGGTLAPDSLAGTGTITVAGARVRAVNLPDLVVAGIESIPLMPQLVSAGTRARYAELFASEDTVIESASVPFTIGRGRLTTEHAVLDNPAYQITGKGWIDEAAALRFKGTVLLGASVSRTLRDDVRAVKYLAEDDGRIALPFVARGRLGAVRVEPDGKRLRERGLTALLGQSGGGSAREPGGDGRQERRPDVPLEEQLLERLERLLRP